MEFLVTLAFLAAALVPGVTGHSWNEQLSLIDGNGKFISNGYPRGYMARTDPGYDGNSMMWMLPTTKDAKPRISNDDFLCHPSQRTKNQTAGYPRLSVTPGSTIAMKYLENGHVTNPLGQFGKQPSGGSVFVFGTKQPKPDAKLKDVLQWTADGSGGDKSGVLIAAQNFDDGQCHQLSDKAMSIQRQQQFPDNVPGQPASAKQELWCHTYVTLPRDIPQGPGAYTLYWVWDWRTLNTAQANKLGGGQHADPNRPDGQDEFYTTCSDYDVVQQPPAPAPNQHTLQQQDPMASAADGYLKAVSAASVKSPAAEPSPAYATAGAGGAPQPTSATVPAAPSAPAASAASTPAAPATTPTATPAPASAAKSGSIAPAPLSVSPLGLSQFQAASAGAPVAAAASAATPSSMSPAASSPASPAGGQVFTLAPGQQAYVVTGGSLVPLHKRAESTATTFAVHRRATPSHVHGFWGH